MSTVCSDAHGISSHEMAATDLHVSVFCGVVWCGVVRCGRPARRWCPQAASTDAAKLASGLFKALMVARVVTGDAGHPIAKSADPLDLLRAPLSEAALALVLARDLVHRNDPGLEVSCRESWDPHAACMYTAHAASVGCPQRLRARGREVVARSMGLCKI